MSLADPAIWTEQGQAVRYRLVVKRTDGTRFQFRLPGDDNFDRWVEIDETELLHWIARAGKNRSDRSHVGPISVRKSGRG